MKLSLLAGFALLCSSVGAFNVVAPPQQRALSTSRYMFGGAGASAPKEDNPEEIAKIEQAAKAMGMSVGEYQTAMNAREELTKALDNTMVTGGKKGVVTVERDVNNPPKKFEITITDEGKALGPDKLSKELCAAMKAASEASKTGRTEAQKKMMSFITEQLKE